MSASAASKPLIALTGPCQFHQAMPVAPRPKRGYRLRVLLRRPSIVPMESRAPSSATGAAANLAAALAASTRDHSASSPIPCQDCRDDYHMLPRPNRAGGAAARPAPQFVFCLVRAQARRLRTVLTEDLAPAPLTLWPLKLAAELGLAALDLDCRAAAGAGQGGREGNMAELLRRARAIRCRSGALAARRSLLALDNLRRRSCGWPHRSAAAPLIVMTRAADDPDMMRPRAAASGTGPAILCRRRCSSWGCARQGRGGDVSTAGGSLVADRRRSCGWADPAG